MKKENRNKILLCYSVIILLMMIPKLQCPVFGYCRADLGVTAFGGELVLELSPFQPLQSCIQYFFTVWHSYLCQFL